MKPAAAMVVSGLESKLAEVALCEGGGFQKNDHDPGVNGRGLHVLVRQLWRARNKSVDGRRRAA